MSTILKTLEGHPFLRGLSTRHLHTLAACATERKVDAGTFVFHEGSPADGLFLVLNGRVVLEIYVPSQGPVQVESVEGGGVIGWSWLVTPHRWHFDARASRASHLVILDGEKVSRLCEQDPELGFDLSKRLMNVVQQRVESLRMQLLDLYGWRGAGQAMVP